MSTSSNVGNTDRIIRAILGVALVLLPFTFELALWTNPLARWASIVVGLVLIATAVFRFCPLYRLFGASTCHTGVR